jgi:hypothetical protein
MTDCGHSLTPAPSHPGAGATYEERGVKTILLSPSLISKGILRTPADLTGGFGVLDLHRDLGVSNGGFNYPDNRGVDVVAIHLSGTPRQAGVHADHSGVAVTGRFIHGWGTGRTAVVHWHPRNSAGV